MKKGLLDLKLKILNENIKERQFYLIIDYIVNYFNCIILDQQLKSLKNLKTEEDMFLLFQTFLNLKIFTICFCNLMLFSVLFFL